MAQRLGVEFLDRAIPTRVADRLSVPLDDALAHDESLGDAIGRFVSSFALLPELAGAMVQAGYHAGEDYRRETEKLIKEHAARRRRDPRARRRGHPQGRPDALHVRLDGPPERRVEQAMELEELSREDAERLRKTATAPARATSSTSTTSTRAIPRSTTS